MDQTDLLFGGPGPPPQPWYGIGGGAAIAYDGSIVTPGNVPGGPQGAGTINANDIYIKGVRLEFLIQGFLPLTGGTLTGLLVISGPNNLQIGLGQAGQILASDGNNNTYWTNTPPGGPYLLTSGGALTGPLTLVDNTYLLIGGGAEGQVLQTDGNSNLTWVNPGGAGSLPPAGTAGYLLATDGASAPYWTNVLPGGPYAPATGGSYLPLAGGTLTGALLLNADPTAPLGAVTKEYVDAVTTAWQAATSTITTNYQAADTTIWKNIGYRNRIINGDMAVDQRHGGQGFVLSVGAYTIDRWRFGNPSNVVSKGTLGQLAVGAASQAIIGGFQYCFGYIVTTAYAVVAADNLAFWQAIEGFNFNDAMWGTAAAQPITIEFWMYGPVAGTYSGMFQNNNSTRSYVFTFTLPATTWTKVRINIPGDTGGTWAIANNLAGAWLGINLGSGSTFTASAANTWLTGNYSNVAGVVSIVAQTGTFNITGVAVMVGAAATNAEPRFKSFNENLIDCQRCYERSYDYGVLNGTVNIAGQAFIYMVLGVTAVTTPSTGYGINFKVSKRAAPTMTGYNPQTGAVGTGYDANSAVSSTINFQGPGMSGFSWYTTVGATAGAVNYRMHWVADADI